MLLGLRQCLGIGGRGRSALELGEPGLVPVCGQDRLIIGQLDAIGFFVAALGRGDALDELTRTVGAGGVALEEQLELVGRRRTVALDAVVDEHVMATPDRGDERADLVLLGHLVAELLRWQAVRVFGGVEDAGVGCTATRCTAD